MMSTFITLLAAAVLSENIVFTKALGFGDAAREEKSLLALLKKCATVAAFMLAATLITYPLINLVLIPLKGRFLAPLLSVLVICGIIFGVRLLADKFLPILGRFLNKNSHLLYCSSILLGVCLMNFESLLITNYLWAILYTLASAVGFTLASLLFFGLSPRLSDESLPQSVRGVPATLIVAALLSMALGGFSGI